MKKVLIAFDGFNFSEGALVFALRLNRIQPIMLTGIFMPQVDYANLWSYAAAAGAGMGPAFIPLIEEDNTDIVQKNIERFKTVCEMNNIKYRVHEDFYDFAIPELKKETRFADVMIVSGELFYKSLAEGMQLEHLGDALHQSECPVIIVPERFEFPDNNILAYDGSEESVYAMKQFAYLFPELAKNKTLLVYAEEKDDKLPSEENIVELISQHFSDLKVYKLEINPKKYFGTWIGDQKGSILVSGSFSRSTFSQMFKKSFVIDMIRDHIIPVFIAHK